MAPCKPHRGPTLPHATQAHWPAAPNSMLLPNYWREPTAASTATTSSSDNSSSVTADPITGDTRFLACLTEDVCLMNSAGNATECATGHQGYVRGWRWSTSMTRPPSHTRHATSIHRVLCAVCSDGYVASGRSCVECWSPWINVLASLGMAMAVLLAVTFIVAKRVNKHSRRSTSKGVLRIFIIFLQTSYTVVSCMLHLLCVAVIWLLT